MLTLYRRHLAKCDHRHEGRQYRRCRCPIWIQGTQEGRPVRKSLDVTSWERAEELKREIMDGAREPAPVIEIPTISDAISKFLLDAEHGRRLAKGTIKKYRVLLSQLKSYAADRGISDLSEITFNFACQFRASWEDGPISSVKKLERFRAFCRHCVLAGWMKENVARNISPPKIRTPPTLPMSEKEIAAALKHADEPRWHALILVLRWSGLRIGDAMKLTVDKLDGNRLFLRTEKTGTPVYVPLPDFVIDELNRLPRYGGYLFWRRAGESLLETATGNARRALRQIFKDAGIKGGHPHRLRDSFAVGLLEKGVPIETVSILLGHANSKITSKHYRPWVLSLQQNLETAVATAWPKAKLLRVK